MSIMIAQDLAMIQLVAAKKAKEVPALLSFPLVVGMIVTCHFLPFTLLFAPLLFDLPPFLQQIHRCILYI